VGDTKPLLAGVSAPPGSESTRPCHAEPFCVAVLLGKLAEKANQGWMVLSWAAVAQQLGCRPKSQPGEADFHCIWLHRVVDECLTSWMAYSCTCKQEEVFQAVDTLLKVLRHGMLHIAISDMAAVIDDSHLHCISSNSRSMVSAEMAALKHKTAQHSTAQHSMERPIL